MNRRGFGLHSRGYRVEVRKEEDGSFSLSLPALPGLIAAGQTFDEAWTDLPDVIDLWTDSAVAEGQPVPEPDGEETEQALPSGRFALRLPRSLHAAVVRRARQEGTSINTYCVTALTYAVSVGSVFIKETESEHMPQIRGLTFEARGYVVHERASLNALRLIPGNAAAESRNAN